MNACGSCTKFSCEQRKRDDEKKKQHIKSKMSLTLTTCCVIGYHCERPHRILFWWRECPFCRFLHNLSTCVRVRVSVRMYATRGHLCFRRCYNSIVWTILQSSCVRVVGKVRKNLCLNFPTLSILVQRTKRCQSKPRKADRRAKCFSWHFWVKLLALPGVFRSCAVSLWGLVILVSLQASF